MKTEIIDKRNDRLIIKDYDDKSLLIKGDYSSSSITSYWVKNRFNDEKVYSVHITYESAIARCDFLNMSDNTDSYYVSQRTIFV